MLKDGRLLVYDQELQKFQKRTVSVFVADKRLRKIYRSTKDTMKKSLESLHFSPQQIIKGSRFFMWNILLPTPECIAVIGRKLITKDMFRTKYRGKRKISVTVFKVSPWMKRGASGCISRTIWRNTGCFLPSKAWGMGVRYHVGQAGLHIRSQLSGFWGTEYDGYCNESETSVLIVQPDWSLVPLLYQRDTSGIPPMSTKFSIYRILIVTQRTQRACQQPGAVRWNLRRNTRLGDLWVLIPLLRQRRPHVRLWRIV